MLESEGFGPALGGVTAILDRDALHRFIRDPAEVFASGDERANELLRRYKAPMPGFAHLKETEVDSILAHIHQQSIEKKLKPLVLSGGSDEPDPKRLVSPVVQSGIVIELEDYALVPQLPERPAYKGITSMRADPREAGAYFVNDLMGVLYHLQGDGPDGKQSSVFLDMRQYFPLFVYEPGVASGLGSFAFHPDFNKNGIFYTTHSEIRHGSEAINADDIPADVPAHESPPLEWVLTEWSQTNLKSVQESFKGTRREVLRFVTPTTAHGSQEINFSLVTDPDDPDYAKLYIACGDGGSFNLKRTDMAGHPRAILGSILRIDPAGTNGSNGQYGIPADNPFANSSDPLVHKEIWAYGFRNPHRFSWDFAHGKRMIAIDIGEANIEEVNFIVPGGSYGWGTSGLEGMFSIDPERGREVVTPASNDVLTKHVLPHGNYDHNEGQAITGGFVYHGPLKALQNKYIFGDIVNGRIFYMNMGADTSDKNVYEILVQRDGVLTDIKTISDVERAHLRVAYDERSGDLFFLTKDDGQIRRVSKVVEQPFGKASLGEDVTRYTLTNTQGMRASIIDYGATVVSLYVPNKNGELADVVIGYDNMQDYLERSHNFGATIGRVASRVTNAKFTLDGKTWPLPKNLRGEHTLHGGPVGFDKVMWSVTEKNARGEDDSITLQYLSRDGDMGFPGNLNVEVTYSLTSDNALKIEYRATTDKATPVNLTHHSYFNLRGEGNGDVLDHHLKIHASRTPSTNNMMPTGEVENIEGSVLDFKTSRRIGDRIFHPDLKTRRGYNNYYIFDNDTQELMSVAKLFEPESGRTMEVLTTEPGLQLYTGNWLNNEMIGKSGQAYKPYSGVCLEPQHYPDSPNQPQFPNTILRPGETFFSTTIYKFGTHTSI